MMPGLDPAQMARVMKNMGIRTVNIEAEKVVIECKNENITIENPSVTEVEMQGQKTYQITGKIKKEERISKEDISMVMEQASVKEEQAKKALEECRGDIAEAIMKLKEKEKD
ncbi:MAG: nascent polypeptide-associated complex protein [Candidatus ainarchaeum sp.]|nr:nascent polypeptide-associated complex protein [Candidatus ainarchaeum sp.]